MLATNAERGPGRQAGPPLSKRRRVPALLQCRHLGEVRVLLGAGDAPLTRRARAKSARQAVVVRFSRTRKRYERQGLLVEPQALAEARRELGRPKDVP